MIVFYSWQSDTNSKSNRYLVRDSLADAINILQQHVKLEIRLDHDTKNILGSPSIADTIFEKIDNSDLFICDVTIINKDSISRKTPNPNVLVELGYAAKSIGWENVVLVLNEFYGKVEELPFDLRARRMLIYNQDPNEKINIKKELQSRLNKILKGYINSSQSNQNSEIELSLDIETLPEIGSEFHYNIIAHLVNKSGKNLTGPYFEIKVGEDEYDPQNAVENEEILYHGKDMEIIKIGRVQELEIVQNIEILYGSRDIPLCKVIYSISLNKNAVLVNNGGPVYYDYPLSYELKRIE